MEPVLLAIEAPELVANLAIAVAATAICGYIAQRLRLVAIVGYIMAGILIGPDGFGLIEDPDLVDQMAEIGIIFLMFFIGLEMSGDLLRKVGTLMFGGGTVQLIVTIAIVTGVAAMFGVGTKEGIYTGCLVALSSTAVVMKLLSSRGETNSPTGETAIAFLLLQDIAIVVMILLIPMLGDGGGDVREVVLETGKALAVIVLTFVVAKFAIPPVLDAVHERTDDEIFLLAVLAIAGGVGYVVTLMGVTASIGAFLAGLVIAAGPHKERASEKIFPFQAVFVAIFFASIGMMLEPNSLLEFWPEILLFCGLVVAMKLVGTSVAAAVFRRPLPIVASSALVLAQIGEFSFILEKVGREAGLTPGGREDGGAQIFIATVVILIALTPLLFNIGDAARKRLEKRASGVS